MGILMFASNGNWFSVKGDLKYNRKLHIYSRDNHLGKQQMSNTCSTKITAGHHLLWLISLWREQKTPTRYVGVIITYLCALRVWGEVRKGWYFDSAFCPLSLMTQYVLYTDEMFYQLMMCRRTCLAYHAKMGFESSMFQSSVIKI